MMSIGYNWNGNKIIAIANGASYGERYYFLKDKRGIIAMIPASVIEVEK